MAGMTGTVTGTTATSGCVRTTLGLAAALLLIAAPLHAGAAPPPEAEAWPCRHAWTAESLSHGPVAVVNGAILPFRNLASGLAAGWQPALLAPFSMGIGLFQGMGVIGLGAFETVTGGLFHTVPPRFAHLNAKPMVQLPESRRDYAYEDSACPRLGPYAGAAEAESY